jgi:hypothetical protein
MGKATPGKTLLAAAAANLAVAGLGAAPAIASTHSTGTTQSVTTNPRGFVPKPRAGVKPFSAHSCDKDVCVHVLGHGLFISYVIASWFGRSPLTCHDGHWKFRGHSTFTSCVMSGSYGWSSQVSGRWSGPGKLCMVFNHVAGEPCVNITRS